MLYDSLLSFPFILTLQLICVTLKARSCLNYAEILEENMRCVHLDFHTSPDITGIGERFDKKKFTETIKRANVDLMTVFAKCHHGYTYYPSKIGSMHPNLRFNLLKEQIEAIHDAGAKAPIYITVGWSKKDADEHPEWHQIDFFTKKSAYVGNPFGNASGSDGIIEDCSWISLCPVGNYLSYLESLTREICESFDVSDGIFYDICFFGEACVCEACRSGMRKLGLDPESYEDAKKYYSLSRTKMMQRLTGVVHEYAKDAPVFYNGGADMNRTEYHQYQTHYELEDLPTAWGGYDLMPVRAKFFEKYGKHFLGMTGKFHHAWGEFGGFKSKDALRYECADMLSVGASISVGDHLHPSGEIDQSTYRVIGHAFDYVKEIEKYSTNTRAHTDLAIWLSHSESSDLGASMILQNMHLEYDVIESNDDICKYKCVILPDKVFLSKKDEIKLKEFSDRGGQIIASYDSAPESLGIHKIAPSEFTNDYIQCRVEDIDTPFLSYCGAYRVRFDEGEVLAQVREPYFNRTHAHFCGHKNTPYKTEAAEYPALVRCANTLYFAHPVFSAFKKSGNYVLEKYVSAAIESIYDKQILTENLPSAGRVRLRESSDGSFLALHILYAPPINRGNACMLTDFPTLHGVGVRIKTDRSVDTVTLEPNGVSIPFSCDNGSLSFTLPPFSLHSLIVIK